MFFQITSSLRRLTQFLKPLAVTTLGAAALWGGEAHAQLFDGPANSGTWNRFDVRSIVGDQPGVETGSAQVGGFVSLFDDADRIFFVDGTSNTNFDTGNWSADIGLGSRFLHQGSGSHLGGNVFYNYRNADTGYGDHDFQTVGFGLEVLRHDWAIRSNTVFNVGTAQSTEFVIPTLVSQVGGPAGVQNILLSSQTNVNAALSSLDLNVSRILSIANAEVGAGVYYLSADRGPESWGINGTGEAWITNNIAANANVSHDDLFDTTVYGGVSVYFGGTRIDADSRKTSSRARLWSAVQRRRVIPVVNHIVPGAEMLATDPGTGELITVLPVGAADNLVAAPAVNTDIIRVDAGATFTGLSPIVLNEGQRLLSASKSHLVDTAEIGSVMIPGTNLGGTTIIDASTGSGGVVIANNTEVSGFTITNATASNGIYGNGVSGFDINRNVLNNNANGIYLQGTNSGSFSNNTVNQNGFRGFHADVFSGTVVGNTANENPIVGFSIFGLSAGTVSNNTVDENGVGFDIGTHFLFSGGTVSNNTANGNDTGFVVNFSGGNNASFSMNEAIDNTFNGYSTSGTPSIGVGTNTGSGNGSSDSF